MRAVLLLSIAGIAAAQNPPPDSLAPLEQAVLKATTDWQGLAKDLEARIARMLPCDPKTKAAIDDVSKASQARLAALTKYDQAALATAENRAEGAKRLLAIETGRNTEVIADKLHADEALAAVDAELADLTRSASVQPALESARGALQQTLEMLKQRLQLARDQAERRDAVVDSLQALAAAYQARAAAVKEATAAFEVERNKWNAYYAARSQRAQTECAITAGPAPAAPPPKPTAVPQGKQK
jgi:hypothetical protein